MDSIVIDEIAEALRRNRPPEPTDDDSYERVLVWWQWVSDVQVVAAVVYENLQSIDDFYRGAGLALKYRVRRT